MVLDLEINGITQTERCIRSQNNDGPRFRRDTGGGGTQYKSGYRDVPQTWVAKSGCQVHQWVPFFFENAVHGWVCLF